MIRPDPGSYRDPEGRVYDGPGDRILRALSADAGERLERFRRQGLLDELARRGLLVETWAPDDVSPPRGWATVLESRPVRPVSYPYEWSFGMLRDAALLTLRLARELLGRGAVLRDASAYNVLFDGHRPVFVDVGSLGERIEGEPWAGYGQFCDHFLAPLLLESCKGVPFQPVLRSNLEGLPAASLSPFLRGFSALRPGVLAHVHLRAWLEKRAQTLRLEERRQIRDVRMRPGALEAQLARLEHLVGGLRSRAATVWAAYAQKTYDEASAAAKDSFVARAAERLRPGATAWDVGANTGRHARLLAARAGTVVAMDADAGAVDALYRSLVQHPPAGRILPLVIDVTNPSPGQGWRGAERADLASRSRPQLATYLALLHHICLARGVPLASALDWIADGSEQAVIEFVDVEDPLSRMILATRPPAHPGYGEDGFRSLCAARGRIVEELRVSPTRLLVLFESGSRTAA